jgi:flagellar hook assembly protein FlgD
LLSNYPNPFNSSTIISFYLKNSSEIELRIIDNLGRIVKNIIKENLNPGYHEFTWDGKDNINNTVSSGVYYVLLLTNGFKLESISKSILFIK